MPKDNRPPKGGDVYEAMDNVDANYIVHRSAPYTTGGKCVIPKQERVIVCAPVQEKPLGFYCVPVKYDEIEAIIIPDSDISEPSYSNYSIFVDTEILTSQFKKIDLLPIKYVKGDATQPVGGGLMIIAHICNDIGGWGKGFVNAISKKWKRPEKEYRQWFKSGKFTTSEFVESERIKRRDKKHSEESQFQLGNVQFVKVDEEIWIANMIAQRNIGISEDGIPPIRYDSIGECLIRLRRFAKRKNASVHMPRIGCGLAGGKWEKIEPLIDQELIAHEIETVVYDFQ